MAENVNTTVIGSDTHIKGEMTFGSSARILGSFEGSITAKGELQVGENATCTASVEAARVHIDGQMDGNVTAHDRVELTPKARMKGDLVTQKLVVGEGASFVGHCRVGPEAGAASKPGPRAASQSEGKPAATKIDAPRH